MIDLFAFEKPFMLNPLGFFVSTIKAMENFSYVSSSISRSGVVVGLGVQSSSQATIWVALVIGFVHPCDNATTHCLRSCLVFSSTKNYGYAQATRFVSGLARLQHTCFPLLCAKYSPIIDYGEDVAQNEASFHRCMVRCVIAPLFGPLFLTYIVGF